MKGATNRGNRFQREADAIPASPEDAAIMPNVRSLGTRWPPFLGRLCTIKGERGMP